MRSFIIATLVSIAAAMDPAQQLLDVFENTQRARPNVLPIRTDRFLESHSSSGSSSGGGTVYVKASCVMGQTYVAPESASSDDSATLAQVVIPTGGCCVAGSDGTTSTKQWCNDTKLWLSTHSTGDCSGSTTMKADMSVTGYSCGAEQVQGVKLHLHQKEDCSDAGTSMNLLSGSCFSGTLELACKDGDVTWKMWEKATDKCKAGSEVATATFKEGDTCQTLKAALAAGSTTKLSYGAMAVVVMVLSAIY